MCHRPDNSSLCDNLESYAKSCEENGGQLPEERTVLCRKSGSNGYNDLDDIFWHSTVLNLMSVFRFESSFVGKGHG